MDAKFHAGCSAPGANAAPGQPAWHSPRNCSQFRLTDVSNRTPRSHLIPVWKPSPRSGTISSE